MAGPCLQLDVGNSSAKWRLVHHGDVLARGKYTPGDYASRKSLLNCGSVPTEVWVASVASPEAEAELCALLVERWGVKPWMARTQAQTAGLRNSYSQPERMGVDRWLVMLAARERVQGRVCVVDAGSALTLDVVSDSGEHEGGYIIPGPALMERALLLDTDRVRFEEEAGYLLSPGTSTAEAVRHGIALAGAGAVCMALDRMCDVPPALLFCGGGGEALKQLVGRGGEFVSDLVFEGLEVMATTCGGG